MDNNNVIILDTETTDINKTFAYDVGYVIMSRAGEILCKKHFVIQQVWHNLPLFESAYYKEKRPLYVGLLRSRKAELTKWGWAMQEMAHDMRKYNVIAAYAFNSTFDDRVFTFNNDWYKTRNPLETVPVFDIWGYSSQFLTNTDEYRTFCELHERFTDTGNYSGNAETLYQFLTADPDFVEAHLGLHDSEIEAQVLLACIKRGAEWDKEYKVEKVLPRKVYTPYTVKVNGEVIHKGEYYKKYVRNGVYSFTEEVGE